MLQRNESSYKDSLEKQNKFIQLLVKNTDTVVHTGLLPKNGELKKQAQCESFVLYWDICELKMNWCSSMTEDPYESTNKNKTASGGST